MQLAGMELSRRVVRVVEVEHGRKSQRNGLASALSLEVSLMGKDKSDWSDITQLSLEPSLLVNLFAVS